MTRPATSIFAAWQRALIALTESPYAIRRRRHRGRALQTGVPPRGRKAAHGARWLGTPAAGTRGATRSVYNYHGSAVQFADWLSRWLVAARRFRAALAGNGIGLDFVGSIMLEGAS